ncbi:hemin uptake protein HemP [Adhaeretor mobilis]|uniref:Hemin uptake protein hemP n=1 Tax=Adhaeretor mobilis TaxID=1930276 RepID=A0A517N2L2_9BACT|nr:hemin uptake protein HemP [Adhaeretor mobilis]QDT01374.1 Hemin uptake protein hemP [Adhaeretor mobilis]
MPNSRRGDEHKAAPAKRERAGIETPSNVRTLDATDLFCGQKQVVIRHAGEDYRLIVTRNNRLILQK